ncbi:Imm1 family immunity protein [Anatilimnocola floriformis]|uniref:Imm1 family immunity protein n=1 Tax=Anatilimnocola floriformis TaxID=2948575 RepID=UPI0020C31EE4|nr:Imm1 family immunity protein [Anatilimnocola floriformis]
MPNAVLEFEICGTHHREKIETVDALVQRIEQLAADGVKNGKLSAFSASIFHEGEGWLIVGVGKTEWLLCHSTLDHEVITSVGDRTATGFEAFYIGDYSEMSRKYLVSRDLAVKAITLWIETAKLSPEIEWTDEIFWE